MTSLKYLAPVVATCLFVAGPVHAAGRLAEFAKEVLTQVAASVVADAIKEKMSSGKQEQQVQEQQVVPASVDDRTRVRNLIAAVTDTTTPLTERIGLFATSVDYFRAGVVGHDFILRDRVRFESRWPNRKYTIRPIDEIAIAPDKTFAIARYTVDFYVSRGDDHRSGVSQYFVLIGSFNSQPRIHSIKEWVQQRHQ